MLQVKMDRNLRKSLNTKQNNIDLKNNISISNMAEGQLSISQERGKPMSLVIKKNNIIHKSYFSSDGNQIVDKNLIVKSNLKVEGSLTGNSYKIIAHNMQDDIGTTAVYLPWFGISESANLTGQSSSFLVPYQMTLEKIMFRPTTITNTSHDLRVKLVKMDDGDTTVDTVATANYTDALASGTLFTVSRSDFDNTPRFGIGDNCGIEILAAGDYGGDIVWKITSVWEIKI